MIRSFHSFRLMSFNALYLLGSLYSLLWHLRRLSFLCNKKTACLIDQTNGPFLFLLFQFISSFCISIFRCSIRNSRISFLLSYLLQQCLHLHCISSQVSSLFRQSFVLCRRTIFQITVTVIDAAPHIYKPKVTMSSLTISTSLLYLLQPIITNDDILRNANYRNAILRSVIHRFVRR